VIDLGDLGADVRIADSGVGGADAATVNGTSLDETFTLSDLMVAVGGEVVRFDANLEMLTANGLDGKDSFTVTGSVGTKFHIDGGDPTTTPGDSLTYDAVGLDLIGGAVLITPGRQQVT